MNNLDLVVVSGKILFFFFAFFFFFVEITIFHIGGCQIVVRIQNAFKTIQTPATEEFEQGN